MNEQSKRVARAVAVCGAVARLYKRYGGVPVLVQSGAEASRTMRLARRPTSAMHYPTSYRGKRIGSRHA